MDYGVDLVIHSKCGKALASIGYPLSSEEITKIRMEAQVSCEPTEEVPCEPLSAPCLFNIKEDPCEKRNLAQRLPGKLTELLKRLEWYNSSAVPPGNLPIDPRGNPKLWHYTWTTFGNDRTVELA